MKQWFSVGGYWLKVSLDIGLVWLACAVAWYLRYEVQFLRLVEPSFYQPLIEYVGLFATLTLVFLVVAHANGVYARIRGQLYLDEMVKIANSTMTSIVIMMAVTFGLQPLAFSRLLFLYAAVLLVGLIGISRLIWRFVMTRLRAQGKFLDNVLIVGGGETGRTVISNLSAQPDLGYRILGFLSDEVNGPGTHNLGRIRWLGRLNDLEHVLGEGATHEVIVAMPWSQHERIREITRLCLNHGLRPRLVPDIFQLSVSRVQVNMLGGMPVLGITEQAISPTGQVIKRAIDLLIAGTVLLVGAVPFAILALLIRFDSPGPVLFRQTRVGFRGRQFKVYKFRTMVEDADEQKSALEALNEADGPLFKIRNDPRTTRLGRLLRSTSIDEFPQFLNVLRGEMSVVGPRPNLPTEIARYEPWHRQRLETKPGITGLSQVSGRSDLSFDETALLDIYYIDNWSVTLDLTIILRTIPHVLSRRGAY